MIVYVLFADHAFASSHYCERSICKPVIYDTTFAWSIWEKVEKVGVEKGGILQE